MEPLPTFEDVSVARELRLNELRSRIYAAIAIRPLVESSHADIAPNKQVAVATSAEDVLEVEVDYF